MKKFLVNTLPYVAIIFLYIIIGEVLLYRIGENIPVSTVVQRQAHATQEYYYGKTLFDDVMTPYKYQMLVEKKSSIVVLGQSIVSNFRDFFFHPYEKDFYNTSLMARNLYDFQYFSSLIKQGKIQKPSFLIVGIDQGLILKNNKLDKKEWLKKLDPDPAYSYKEHLRALQNVYLKADVREVPALNHGVGKRGMVGNGYRKDGSFAYAWELGLFINDSTHVEGPLKDELVSKTEYFKLPIEVEPTKWKTLINILEEYRSMGIEVLIYFPPLTDTFYNFARQDKAYTDFWDQYLALQDVLEQRGFDLIRFTTPSKLGLNDYYMNNANHAGDILVATQFYNYCKSTDRKNKFVDQLDLTYLESLLKNHKNPLSFMRDTLVYPKEWRIKQ